MKYIWLLGIIFFIPTLAFAQSETESNPVTSELKEAKAEVFYFHYTRRCLTCNTVEEVSKDAVEKYGDKVVFYSVNLDEEEGKQIGKSLNVTGQSLIIVGNDKQHDLTNEGFMFARSKPKKLVQLIQSKIDAFI